MPKLKKAAILGASGYTGAEAIRLLARHPKIEIAALSAHSRAGEAVSTLYPNFAGLDLPDMQKWQDIDFDEIDVAFACLPHGASQDTIAQIADKVETVIDLSADFRLQDPATYEAYYGRSHDYPDLLAGAVYGLTEYARAELPGAKLVACPGCYPTCSLLTLLPGIEAGLLRAGSLIIDAKSGVTGAGRKAVDGLLYAQLTDGAHAYAVASHRHSPEIDQMLTRMTRRDIKVSFTPHLIPMNRGMITTIYAQLNEGASFEGLKAAYHARYDDEAFVFIEQPGDTPQTRHVRGANQFRLGLFKDRLAGRVILIGVIDNLVKGSSGQAVQNYNLTQGWEETLGLTNLAVFP